MPRFSLTNMYSTEESVVTCISCMSLPTFWTEDSLTFSSLDCSRSFFFMSTSWPSSSCSLFLRCSLSLEAGQTRVSAKIRTKAYWSYTLDLLGLVGVLLCRLEGQNQLVFLLLKWIHGCLQSLNIFLQNQMNFYYTVSSFESSTW